MIPPHLFYQIYLSFLDPNDCTPPKCDKLSEHTDSVHTEVEDLFSRWHCTKSSDCQVRVRGAPSNVYGVNVTKAVIGAYM